MHIAFDRPVVVLGGGPAGLTAGYLLAKAGKPVVVVEAEGQIGGLAKTVVDPEGYRKYLDRAEGLYRQHLERERQPAPK